MNRLLFRIATAIFLLGLVCLAQSRAQLTLMGVGGAGSGLPGVTVDQTSSTFLLCASGTTCTFSNHTITGGLSNSALVCALAQSDTTNAVTGMTITWDSGGTNQSMTQVANLSAVGNNQVWLFALLAPTSGNKSLSMSWTGTSRIFVDCISLFRVLQTSIATSFLHATTGTAATNPASLTVTSQTRDLVITSWATPAAWSGVFSGTSIYFSNGGVTDDAAASYDPGAASVIATATMGAANNWWGASIDVVHQ